MVPDAFPLSITALVNFPDDNSPCSRISMMHVTHHSKSGGGVGEELFRALGLSQRRSGTDGALGGGGAAGMLGLSGDIDKLSFDRLGDNLDPR